MRDSEELVGSSLLVGLSLSRRVWCIELLLLMVRTSGLSSERVRLKNEPFDAVMGVVGVLRICRVGGGLRFLSVDTCSCKAAILAAVGVLRGPSVIGGSLNGCRFFFG